MATSDHPHQQTQLASAGASLDEAQVAVVLLHGRGATAQSILTLADQFSVPTAAYVAPQAAGHTWYPYSFLAPFEQNEPFLTSALQAVDETVEYLRQNGFSDEQILIMGFSQGACLATEYTARHPSHYGGIVAFSGGLIGPKGTTFEYEGSLEQTPVFLGCSDQDPHIPLARVQETTQALSALDAEVTERIYEGMGHTVNEEELTIAGDMVAAAARNNANT